MKKIRYWKCDICGKEDNDGTDEQLAKPEHISHRGVDIGTCKGEMKEVNKANKLK